MLVLSRKKNEQIVIGSNVKIVVLGVRGNTIRLGIEAPPDVPIHRLEVAERIQAESELPGDVWARGETNKDSKRELRVAT